MNSERVFSLKNPWFIAAAGGLILIALIAAAVGFVWLPSAQGNASGESVWNRICRAAGVAEPWRPAREPVTPVARPSDVIVNAQMMYPADSPSIGRGATLAMQCTMCHGARGMSQANSPNLAGQHAESMYKQLRDFKAGYRKSAVMAPMVAHLSDQDMRDLAAYYAYLPRERPATASDVSIPVIVSNGAPMRGIAACASCHGGEAYKTASPRLDGEPAAYIRAQLAAFADGSRRNDINRQMRNIVRQLTAEEIDEAARYYASR